MKQFNKLTIQVILLTTFLLFATNLLYADLNGKTGRTSTTSNGCGSCHGSSANSATTVTCSSQSGSFTVQPNSTTTFTVTISHASLPKAGVNIAVKTDQTGTTNIGTLSPETGSGLKLSNGELTNSSPKSLSGGSVSFNFTWTAPSTSGTYYLRAIGNAVNNNGGDDSGDLWNWMPIQTITVASPSSTVSITSPVGGESWCPGTSKNITWTSSGITNVKIELSSDGGGSFPTSLIASTPAAAGTWSWSIPAGQTPGTLYKVRISDAANASVNSVSASNFTVPANATFTTHPQALSVCPGVQASFSVTTSGTVSSYKWQRNNVDLANSNSATYTIPSTSEADNGSYTCIITSTCGAQTTSNAAILTVKTATAINTQPQSKDVCLNESVSLTVVAVGTGLTYQWRKNSSPITNAVSATYSIPSAKQDDAGNYDVIVTGQCGTPITSQQALLKVNSPPAITVQPQPVNACIGTKALLYVVATGTNLKYQWKKDGTAISGNDNDSLIFNNVAPTDVATYEVLVSGTCIPDITSSSVTLSIIEKPEITLEPTDIISEQGQTVEFNVASTGKNLKYQWRKENVNLSGKTSSKLIVQDIKTTDEGNYNCVVTNECGSVTSKTAKLTVNVATGPICTLATGILDFSAVLMDTSKDTVISSAYKNTGNQDLIISAITLSGKDSKNFKLISIPTLPITLKKDESKSFTVSFNPLDTGNLSAYVTFTCNGLNNPTMELRGIGAYTKFISDKNKISYIFEFTETEPQKKVINLNNYANIPSGCSLSIEGNDNTFFSIDSPGNSINFNPMEIKAVSIKCDMTGKNSATAELSIKNLITSEISAILLEAVRNTNSIHDFSTGVISIMPNPVSDNFEIIVPDEFLRNSTIMINDIFGNKLLTQSINSGSTRVNIANFSDGIYFLVLISDSQIFNTKLIKRNN